MIPHSARSIPHATGPSPIPLDARIYIAGHEGLVGSALMRALGRRGHSMVITRSFRDLDLRNQAATQKFFEHERPEYVIVAAARVGGIQANIDAPAEFLMDNLLIAAHVIDAAHRVGTRKLLFLGSSCMYPRDAAQPLAEGSLLTGAFEPTNAPYALAKCAGVELCRTYSRQYGDNFISCVPTNLYGPGDLFDRQKSHVIPALVEKFCRAVVSGEKTVTLWGTGSPLREFLYVDDCADALFHLLECYNSAEPVNIGSGEEYSIAELAHSIAQYAGFTGEILFDATKPDGMPRKALDSSRIRSIGWVPKVSLSEGLIRTIGWYREHVLCS